MHELCLRLSLHTHSGEEYLVLNLRLLGHSRTELKKLGTGTAKPKHRTYTVDNILSYLVVLQ